MFAQPSSQSRHDLEHIAHDAEIRGFEDRRFRIAVDRDDDVRLLHPNEMLDRAGNAACDVDAWAYGLSGLADLVLIGNPSGHDGCPRGANDSAYGLCKVVEHVKRLRAAKAS